MNSGLFRLWPPLTLVVLDLLGWAISIKLAFYLRFGMPLTDVLAPLVIAPALCMLTIYVLDGYNTGQDESRWRLPMRGFIAIIVFGLTAASILYAMGLVNLISMKPFWRSVLPFAILGSAIWSAIGRIFVAYTVRGTVKNRHWIAFGDARKLDRLSKDFEWVRPVATLESLITTDNFQADEQRLSDFLMTPAHGVIRCTEQPFTETVIARLTQLRIRGIHIYGFDDFYEQYLVKVPLADDAVNSLSIAEPMSGLNHPVAFNAKRVIDVTVSFVLLLLLLPLMLFVALMIKLDIEGPILYRQQRVGLMGKLITINKLRTMRVDAESDGVKWARADDPRITRVGRILRRLRLDELPQLWNVLKGEMSLIGPRPERPEITADLENQIPFYDLRHLIKPGISGWAQVKQPYGSSVDDSRRKLEYDLYYIKNYSLPLDFIIAIKTIRIVMSGSGI